MTTQYGKVYLVGAGPGDPGLITVRGRECIARADVIISAVTASQAWAVADEADRELRGCRHGASVRDEINSGVRHRV